MKRLVGVLFTLLLLVTFRGRATTYYLSPSGNDSWPGTTTIQPWKTLGKLLTRNFKGDTILLKGGSTFYGRIYFDSADAGTATKPIVVGAYGTASLAVYLVATAVALARGCRLGETAVEGVLRMTSEGLMVFVCGAGS